MGYNGHWGPAGILISHLPHSWKIETEQTSLISSCVHIFIGLSVFMTAVTTSPSGCPALVERISKERASLSLSHTHTHWSFSDCCGWKPKHKHMFEQESEQLVFCLPVLEQAPDKTSRINKRLCHCQIISRPSSQPATELTVGLLIQMTWIKTSWSLRHEGATVWQSPHPSSDICYLVIVPQKPLCYSE